MKLGMTKRGRTYHVFDLSYPDMSECGRIAKFQVSTWTELRDIARGLVCNECVKLGEHRSKRLDKFFNKKYIGVAKSINLGPFTIVIGKN